jgi:acyl transferase domain-containing protein
MKNSGIAIVGMAGRFPGARNIDEFWRNLRDGVESIRQLSEAELLDSGVSPDLVARPDYVKAAAVLDGVDMFDASFFGLSPRDAAIMDPQQRHFLECAWEAVENAGHPPELFDGSIGVFAGCGTPSYLIHNLIHNSRLMDSAGLFLIRQTGNDKDVLATRVSYQLDLRGPSLTVQTACSTSLVAVHQACQSLLNCECDMALAGGATIEIPHGRGYLYREGEILSRDGHCRAFDAASSGTVFSSGVGIVVLRRLDDAIADHDTIYAVILGSAVNNDGRRKVGYLAPSVAGQAEAIAEALGVAGVNAETITYVETHGTGTAVGDPLEIKGLTQAFRGDTARTGYCAIGSLKTNMGHLDTAAGVAGLIKTALALRHRLVPASLNFQNANPQIDFGSTPFYVNTSLIDWKSDGTPRRAGVTALGIGGTNAHVVLEEAPAPNRAGIACPHQIIPLSARTETALEAAGAQLAAHLREHPELRLADVAFTCQVGREAFRHRRVVVASGAPEAASLLADPVRPRKLTPAAVAHAPSSVVFLFPGQGSQYPNMGAELYNDVPLVRTWLDRCADQLQPHLNLDLRDILFPSAVNAGWAAQQLNRTSITQPALFALEYSLAQWWIAVGVRPDAMLGHSIGEYVAACLADVISVEDALAIISFRGRLMEQSQPGSMLAVSLSREKLELPVALSLAALNAPDQCVVSGPDEAVTRFEQAMVQNNVSCRRLQASHAFHSALMDSILESFVQRMGQIALRSPRIPYLSNLTGEWITAIEATDPEYWARHLRDAVQFAHGVGELLRQSGRVMIEIGPGQTLASLVRQQIGKSPDGNTATVFSSLPRREQAAGETASLLLTLGQLWIGGRSVDWHALHHDESKSRIPLPTYPFQRKRYWIDPDKPAPQQEAEKSAVTTAPSQADEGAEIAERTDRHRIAQWFYERTWQRTPRPDALALSRASWIVFLELNGLGIEISTRLRGVAHPLVIVTPGRRFKRSRRGQYTIRPGVRDDYDKLLADLARRQISPEKIVHLWSTPDRTNPLSLDDTLNRSFYSLLFLAQALGAQDMKGIEIGIVSNCLHRIHGEPAADPVCATVLGPTRVIAKELPGLTCRGIDIDLDALGKAQAADQIIAELCTPFRESVVAIRRGERWIECLEPAELHTSANVGRLRESGVYLITGGLGDLGLVIAEELAREFRARLVLLGRTPLVPAREWNHALESSDTPLRLKLRIKKLVELQSMGAEILYLACDVSRRDEIKRAIALARARFGALDGVIHAAGVIDDGPLLIKSRASAASVLEPKVKGTHDLVDVLTTAVVDTERNKPLDFVALFSSVSSLSAPAGQVDYIAANAFLNAFAASRRDVRVVAINWDAWRDVGMAARVLSAHPLLGRRLVDTGSEIVYKATLCRDRHWILAEHCLKTGQAVLPGTGYLEMATAALTNGAFDQGVSFEDVFFQSPFIAENDQ